MDRISDYIEAANILGRQFVDSTDLSKRTKDRILDMLMGFEMKAQSLKTRAVDNLKVARKKLGHEFNELVSQKPPNLSRNIK